MNFTNLQIQSENLPKVENVELKLISKSYFKIIAFNKLIFYAALIGFVVLAKYSLDIIKEIEINLWYILPFVIGFCILNFIIALLAFKKRKYAIREHDVLYAKGLLIHSMITVPMSRIQHVEESRSWLARHFGLAALKIFTAGEAGSDLIINGLPHLEAKQIKELISAKVNGNN